MREQRFPPPSHRQCNLDYVKALVPESYPSPPNIISRKERREGTSLTQSNRQVLAKEGFSDFSSLYNPALTHVSKLSQDHLDRSVSAARQPCPIRTERQKGRTHRVKPQEMSGKDGGRKKQKRRFAETNPMESFDEINGIVQQFQWIC